MYPSQYSPVQERSVYSQLQKLGYKQPLSSNSLPLLAALTKDILILKEEIEQYKQLITKVQKEKFNLEKGLIPYQLENGKLLIENSDLQGEILSLKQKHDKEKREFKKKNREKNLKVSDLEFLNKITQKRLEDLENELYEKNSRILNLVYRKTIDKNTDGKLSLTSPFIGSLNKSNLSALNVKTDKKKQCNQIGTKEDVTVKFTLEAMNERNRELLEELEELKLDNQHQTDIIGALKCQITQKDREICRLKHSLEGGRPLSSVNRDCCFQCKQAECRIKALEKKLDEAVEKQHEAMSRALHLADQNQHLEKELKNIDHMALTVEEDCQKKMKNNLMNMDVMEEKLRQRNDEIAKLENTILNMKARIERDEIEIENLKKEKETLEKNLHIAAGEKKQLNDKINYFLIIENNLKSELTRVQEINKSLQRHICDMEGRVMDILGTNCRGQQKGLGKQKKSNYSSSYPSAKSSSTNFVSHKNCKGDKKCLNEQNKSDECFHTNSNISFFEKVQEERDFYHDECHRLKDQLKDLQCHADNTAELLRQFKELEREVASLKEDNFSLRRENKSVVRRLECSEHLSCSSGDSLKIILDRLEKERDMALSDISRLQLEREELKERIRLATESQIGEQARLEKIVRENEERIRRLESERRELITSQSSQRISLAKMEERCDDYKENTRKAQYELAQMKANYNQLKTLQEQTDRSLGDVQSRLSQADIEIRMLNNKLQDSEKLNGNLQDEISRLKKEKTNMMSNLTFTEKEKDGLLISLDEKTERMVKLEGQIKKQEAYITELKDNISHLEKKFEYTLNEKTSREYGLRSLEREVERLKEELQQCELQKEALIRENRRLQDDLSSAAKDCLTARRELDLEKQDVENLKKQLQQYVSEVKRAEELLTKKETERNQMLEHFRSLSIEATTLETNNHTLESTVENTKTQLHAANNRIMDLEHDIASKESLLYSYEKQIAELSTQVAELETQVKHQTELKNRAEEDLTALRELCSSLDGQKEALKKQANSSDIERAHLINEVRRLSEEYDGLSQKLVHERSLSQTLEKSLTNSRQETLEHKITNKDLQTHVQHLRQKVDELTEKLESESQDVRRYQSQCAELSEQVSELRREITNARFEQAKAMEESRRFVETSKPDSDDDCPSFLTSSASSLPVSTRTFVRTPEKSTKRIAFLSEAPVPSKSSEFSPEDRLRKREPDRSDLRRSYSPYFGPPRNEALFFEKIGDGFDRSKVENEKNNFDSDCDQCSV